MGINTSTTSVWPATDNYRRISQLSYSLGGTCSRPIFIILYRSKISEWHYTVLTREGRSTLRTPWSNCCRTVETVYGKTTVYAADRGAIYNGVGVSMGSLGEMSTPVTKKSRRPLQRYRGKSHTKVNQTPVIILRTDPALKANSFCHLQT